MIYKTGTTHEGVPLIGGIWRMYREQGFPVEMSLMEIKDRGCLPDYAEMLLEAGKFGELHNAGEELRQLVPKDFNELGSKFSAWVVSSQKEGETFDQTCGRLLEQKQKANEQG